MTSPPTPTADDMAIVVGREAGQELTEAQSRIEHCLRQLTDEQVWWRPGESRNSIGNLVLHLCGNLRQWCVTTFRGLDDERDRPAEFAARQVIPRAELLARLDATVADARRVLAGLSAAELLRTRRIQGFEMSGIGAIFHTVPHFRGHAQEIIHITREILGDRYQFAWQPATKEQGAA